MRTTKLLVMWGILILAGSAASFAETGDAGQPGAFLSWGAGARSMAMGKAFTGIANDASAIYWNPAGLTQLYSNQLTAFHAALFEDTSFDFVGYAHPLSQKLTLAGGWVRLASDNYEFRDSYNNGGQSFKSEESAYLLSAADKLFDNFSLGASVKLVNQEIYTYKASGAGMDLGALYQAARWLNLGLNLQNVVQPSIKLNREADIYPLRAVLGAGIFLFDDKLAVALDAGKTDDQAVKFATGAEFWCCPFLALRGGWNQTETTAGAGIKTENFRIDYAFGTQDLGTSHRFSFTVDFGMYRSKVKANPNVFSTMGDSEHKVTKLNLKAWAKYGVKRWRLVIENGDGRAVRTWQGENVPPAEIVWNGRDAGEQKVADGAYKCVLTITDGDGRSWTSTAEKVEIITEVAEPKINVEITQ